VCLTYHHQCFPTNVCIGGIRWIRPYLLPPLPGLSKPDDDEQREEQQKRGGGGQRGGRFRGESSQKIQRQFFRVDRMTTKTATRTADGSSSSSLSQFTWEDEWNDLIQQQQRTKKDSVGNIHIDLKKEVADEADIMESRKLISQPVVDYTSKDKYRYPALREEPPPPEKFSEYPQLTSLASMMEHWDQDEDFHGTITETLLHFNFSDPDELEMARKFRDAELPFKLTNVPELTAANLKWTDEYVSKQFDREVPPRGYLKSFFQSKTSSNHEKNDPDLQAKPASGLAQESPNHYFAFFTPPQWHVETMGLPPVRNNDWTYAKWAEHARYADAVRLAPDQPHFYWQSGVDKEERHGPKNEWTFISRDLPSWSSPTPTFMVFDPKAQKGIQCRFGERGVVAATHYDSGRNMVGMITGAKRYILSPPRACSKLGIFTHQKSPIFRHSLLNFGHLKYLNNNNNDEEQRNGDNEEGRMSKEERAWLERASQAQAVETVLKAGEVLYIVSLLV
jgi:Cupin-like domain